LGKTKTKLLTDLNTFNNLNIPSTPLHRLNRISELLDVDIWIKRDDLIPFCGGGNKARMMAHKVREIEQQNCDAVVTAGPTQSNHARVTALLSASKGWKCKLILHGSKRDLENPNGNLLLMLLSGAEVEIVDKDEIRKSVESSLSVLKNKGYTPYEIHGGENLTGSIAYFEAVKELRKQCDNADWIPEWIVHASATGTTQAGILLGINNISWDANVIGISAARKNPRGCNVVKDKCEELAQILSIDLGKHPVTVDFKDNWVGEGYGLTNRKTNNAIRFLASNEGIILDPTYTGKAFAGLLDLVNTKEITPGDRVLFWHTGGMYNLFSSEYTWEMT